MPVKRIIVSKNDAIAAIEMRQEARYLKDAKKRAASRVETPICCIM